MQTARKEGSAVYERDIQIELIMNARSRAEGYAQNWLNDPEVRAALHRYDFDAGQNGAQFDRAAGCA